jgi:hypothetical protein
VWTLSTLSFFSNNYKLYIYLDSETKLHINVTKVKLCFNIWLHMMNCAKWWAQNPKHKLSFTYMLRIQRRIYHTFLLYVTSLFQRYRPYCVGIDRKVMAIKNWFGKSVGLFDDTGVVETAVNQAFIFTQNKCRRPLLHQPIETHKQEIKWIRNTEIRVHVTSSELPEILLCISKGEIPVISWVLWVKNINRNTNHYNKEKRRKEYPTENKYKEG